MSSPILQASCLCGSAPCLLCSCCPSSNNSTVTRLVFSFFLLLGTLVSALMILPGMETQLRKVRDVVASPSFLTFNLYSWPYLDILCIEIERVDLIFGFFRSQDFARVEALYLALKTSLTVMSSWGTNPCIAFALPWPASSFSSSSSWFASGPAKTPVHVFKTGKGCSCIPLMSHGFNRHFQAPHFKSASHLTAFRVIH